MFGIFNHFNVTAVALDFYKKWLISSSISTVINSANTISCRASIDTVKLVHWSRAKVWMTNRLLDSPSHRFCLLIFFSFTAAVLLIEEEHRTNDLSKPKQINKSIFHSFQILCMINTYHGHLKCFTKTTFSSFYHKNFRKPIVLVHLAGDICILDHLKNYISFIIWSYMMMDHAVH